jgi:hypothetical protein
MRIIRIVEKPGSRRSEYDDAGGRRFSIAYTAQTDVVVNEVELRRFREVPSEGDSYDLDPRAGCKRVACQRDATTPLVWSIECEWERAPDAEQDDKSGPDSRPSSVRVSWSSVPYEEFEHRDLDDRPMLDAAGMPFSQPVAIPRRHLLLTIQRRERSYDAMSAYAIGDSVNSAPWFGFPRYTVKADFPDATQEEESRGKGITYRFWNVTYKFQMNRRLWIPSRVLNAGFKCLNDAGKLVDCTDEVGNPASRPMLLTRDGKQETLGPKAEPNFREFRVYYTNDFNLLGLV